MSTQEVNSGILTVVPQDELWNELAPSGWKDKPKAYTSDIYQWNENLPDGSCVRRVAKIVPCMYKCAGEVPTKEEAQELINKVKALGEPVAFLQTLASLHVPEFPEDKDPTVKEFFEGSFDLEAMTVKTVLVVYPAIEIKE